MGSAERERAIRRVRRGAPRLTWGPATFRNCTRAEAHVHIIGNISKRRPRDSFRASLGLFRHIAAPGNLPWRDPLTAAVSGFNGILVAYRSAPNRPRG
jgi:hypothetical protein